MTVPCVGSLSLSSVLYTSVKSAHYGTLISFTSIHILWRGEGAWRRGEGGRVHGGGERGEGTWRRGEGEDAQRRGEEGAEK